MAFIPILNIYVLCKMVGRPSWWVVFFFVPVIGLVLLHWMFLFILALNKDRYRGPIAATP